MAEQQIVTQAEEAREVEASIVSGCSAIRTAWILLAERLEHFHAERMWAALGYETFEEWLGSPEISLSQSHSYALMEGYRELVKERGLTTDDLAGIEITKVRTVLPALRRGEVEVEDALADARTLSRSDLTEKYADRHRDKLDAEREPERCSECGQPLRRSK